MNTRQAKLISELTNQFEMLNERNNVKTTLIDIASIRKDLDEAKQIRQEIESHNEILLSELRSNFVSKLKQVKEELESIGILSVLTDDDYPNLKIGMYRYQDSLLPYDSSFFISYYTSKKHIYLSDNTSVEKIVGLNIHITHGEYFNSVDELVKTEKFIDRIKVLAKKNK